MPSFTITRDAAQDRFYSRNENYTWLEVMKMWPNPCSTFFLCAQTDFIRLTPYQWQPWIPKFYNIRKGWLCKTSYGTSNPIFDDIKKRWLWKISCWISNPMFDDRTSRCLFFKKFCNVILFLMSRMLKTQGCQLNEATLTNKIYFCEKEDWWNNV